MEDNFGILRNSSQDLAKPLESKYRKEGDVKLDHGTTHCINFEKVVESLEITQPGPEEIHITDVYIMEFKNQAEKAKLTFTGKKVVIW